MLVMFNSFKPGILFMGRRQTEKPQMGRRVVCTDKFNEIKKMKITPNSTKNEIGQK